MVDFRERYEDHNAALQCALDGRQAQIWTNMPGIVKGVNLVAMTVAVQVAIMGRNLLPNGSMQFVTPTVIPDVPIVYPSGGGYTITFPIAIGDECVLQFHSRCIDSWWQSGGVQPPLDVRLHDFTDATAHFGPKSQPNVIPNVSSNSTQLRSNDGKLVVDLNSGTATITITTPTAVIINTETVTVNASDATVVNTPTMTVNGVLNVTGEITANYGTGDSVNLSQHRHGVSGSTAASTVVPTPGT